MEVFTLFIVLYSTLTSTLGVKVNPGSSVSLAPDNSRNFFARLYRVFRESDDVLALSAQMSKYLESHDLDPEEFVGATTGSKVTAFNEFVSRCKAGDCFSLELVTVTSPDGLYRLRLPNQTQLNILHKVFKKSDTSSHRENLKRVFNHKRWNRDAVFNEAVIRANFSKMGVVKGTTNCALNEFFLSAALYYTLYFNSSLGVRFHRLTRSKALFKAQAGGLLHKTVRDVTHGMKLLLDFESANLLVEAFSTYLIGSSHQEPDELHTVFVSLCKEALSKVLSGSVSGYWIREIVLGDEGLVDEFCGEDNTCKEPVQEFVDRCKNGDCLTVENTSVSLSEGDHALTVVLPNLKVVEFLLHVFKKSRANGSGFKAGLKKVLKVDTSGNLEELFDLLFDKNVGLKRFDSPNSELLTKALYKETLFVETTLFRSLWRPAHKIGSKRLSSFLVTLTLKRKLGNIIEGVFGDAKLSVKPHLLLDLSTVYSQYLSQILDGNYKPFLEACSEHINNELLKRNSWEGNDHSDRVVEDAVQGEDNEEA